MAPFARLVGGEWKMTAPAGSGLYNTWHWGPGKHSLRMLTDGIGGDRNPWRALQVVYWHPGHKQVRSIQLSTYAAGVAESAIAFDGENAEAVTDMYQTGDRRKLKSRWKFAGPDKYHDELLETTTGREGYFLLAEWDWVRIATRPRDVEQAPKVSEHLKPFEPLLGGTWESTIEAKLAWAPGAPLQLQSSSEYIPLANGIYIRTLALTKDAEPMHLLDAYIYHHTGANALRCLALSHAGGVYEGDITVLDEGHTLQIDLKGYEGDKVVPLVAQFEFEKDGTLRQRVWSVRANSERVIIFDVRYEKRKS